MENSNNNPVIDNIKNRRSIRRYIDRPLPKEVIEQLIECGTYAPSSHNRQPWNFVIIADKQKMDGLSEDIRKWYHSMIRLGKPVSFIKRVKKTVEEMEKRVNSEKDLFFYHAPCVILIHAKNSEFFRNDCACAAQNMLLAARSMEIGSCWIGFSDIVLNRSKKIRQKYGVPANHKVMATLIFGYTEKFPTQALPRREADKVWF